MKLTCFFEGFPSLKFEAEMLHVTSRYSTWEHFSYARLVAKCGVCRYASSRKCPSTKSQAPKAAAYSSILCPFNVPLIIIVMNRESALTALQTINAKVSTCTQNEVRPDVVDCLESASKKLVEAVTGDAYAQERTNNLVVFVRAGFLGVTCKPISYRQEILESVKTLYSYISRRPDYTDA